MKKALLFIGLALFATAAIAQTNNYAKPVKQAAPKGYATRNIAPAPATLQKADYKASVFTKDAGDTIGFWDFNTNPASAGVVYGLTNGVPANSVINGEAVPEDMSSIMGQHWQWIQDSTYFSSADYGTNYPRLSQRSYFANYMRNYLMADGGGIMLCSFIDPVPPAAGSQDRTNQRPHALLTFPTRQKSASDQVVVVSFRRIYRKFYDQSFIDYKINGAWKTREIHVDGVDAAINDFVSLNARYVMPLELGNETNIDIRFRYLGGVRSNAWGYMWAVDNVLISVAGNNGWRGGAPDYVTGAYGTTPKDMQLPLTWWANIYNEGIATVTGMSVTANHLSESDQVTPILNVEMDNAPAGNAATPYPVYINEAGFLLVDSLNDAYYYRSVPGALGATGHYDTVMNDVQYRGVPTSTVGRNRLAISVDADDHTTLAWDTMPYRVVASSAESEQYGILGGYRWGHDNGIIPTGDSYMYGLTIESGNTYLSDSGSYTQPGYCITSRYTTGAVIPLDNQDQPWVLKGVEIITSPDIPASELEGTKIRPVVFVNSHDADGTIHLLSLITGVDDVVYTYTANSTDPYTKVSNISNEMSSGYLIANDGEYGAVNIFFPRQPALTPNFSYRVGYEIAARSTFAAATTRASYKSSNGSYVYYSDSTETELNPWANQFTPNQLDVTFMDPVEPQYYYYASSYDADRFPMIRAIVGPRQPLETYTVEIICESGQSDNVEMTYNGQDACALEEIEVFEGEGPTFYMTPLEHYILDSLFIDGVHVVPATLDQDGDENFVTSDGSIYDTIEPWGEYTDSIFCNLERENWTYTFRNISGNHNIRVTYREGQFIESGIDPVAPEVRMILAPNPATSMVKLGIKGVTGMVDCSVIDMSGRVVYSRQINAENSNFIDLSNVPAGAYFVRITNNVFSKVEKLIVR